MMIGPLAVVLMHPEGQPAGIALTKSASGVVRPEWSRRQPAIKRHYGAGGTAPDCGSEAHWLTCAQDMAVASRPPEPPRPMLRAFVNWVLIIAALALALGLTIGLVRIVLSAL
jgi:hypothetical protein